MKSYILRIALCGAETWNSAENCAGEGWRRLVGQIVCKMKYFVESREGTSHVQRN